MYKSEEEFLEDFRSCKKCKCSKHVLDMKIFLTGEVSRYCKGCYSFNPKHSHKIRYLRKYKFKGLNKHKAIDKPKNLSVFVNN